MRINDIGDGRFLNRQQRTIFYKRIGQHIHQGFLRQSCQFIPAAFSSFHGFCGDVAPHENVDTTMLRIVTSDL